MAREADQACANARNVLCTDLAKGYWNENHSYDGAMAKVRFYAERMKSEAKSLEGNGCGKGYRYPVGF